MGNSSSAKISVSIDPEQLKWIDEKIAKKEFAGRSHAVQFCIYQCMKAEKEDIGSGHQ